MPKNKPIKVSSRTVVCYYCEMICIGSGTKDHRYPVSQFKNTPHNKVFSCRRCNQAKDNMTEEEFKKTDYYRNECLTKRWRGFQLKNNTQS